MSSNGIWTHDLLQIIQTAQALTTSPIVVLDLKLNYRYKIVIYDY